MRKALVLLFIFLLAFSIRLITIYDYKAPLESDEIEYDRLAVNLLEGKGYIDSTYGTPTSLRPPLYPAILALIYRIFGHNFFVVRLIQAFLGSLAVCLLYLTAYKIFNGVTALLTGIFSSFYMTFTACAGLLFTETFFLFLLALLIYLVIASDKISIIRFCAVGILCGLLTLMKSAAFFLPLLVIFFTVLKIRKKHFLYKRVTAVSLLLIISFLAVITPWIIRNYNVHQRFVLISTNGGLNLYQAVNWSGTTIYDLDRDSEIIIKISTILNEAERSNLFVKAAIRIYKNQPLFALRMALIRFLFFWGVIDWSITGGETINYHYIFILPFAFLGTFLSFKNRKDILILVFPILYFTSFVLLFPGAPRYRMPIDGYLIMLGAYGIWEIVNGKRRKAYPITYIGLYLGLTYFLYKYSAETKHFIKAVMQRIGLW